MRILMGLAGTDDRGGKTSFWIVFVVLLLGGLALRFESLSFYRADLFGSFNFFDPDSYYQLRRLLYFVQNFPQTLRFDALADWPSGSWVDWPDALMWLVGPFGVLFGVNSFRGVELLASSSMIFFAVFFACFQFLSGRELFKSRWLALLAFIFIFFHPYLVTFSALGRFDHHILEFGAGSLLVWIFLQMRKENSGAYAAIAGFILFVGLNISSSFLFWIAFAVLGLLFFRLNWRLIHLFFLGLGLPLILQSAWNYSEYQFLARIDYPSFFHLSAVVGLYGFLAAAILFVQKRHRAFSFCLGGLLLATIVFFWIEPNLLQIWRYPFDYVFGRSGALIRIDEAQPLLFFHGEFTPMILIRYFGVLILSIPFGVWILFRWKTLDEAWRWLLVGFLLFLVIAFAQRRFASLAIPLMVFVFCWGLQEVSLRLNSLKPKIRFALGFFVVMIFLIPGFQFGFVRFDFEEQKLMFSIAVQAKKTLGLEDRKIFETLGGKSEARGGILLNPNLGHLIQYRTGLGVGSNAFFHGNALQQDLNLRTIQSDEEFLRILKGKNFQYILAMDDFRYLELLAQIFNQNLNFYQELDERDGRVYDLAVLDDYAYSRLIINAEQSPPAFEYLFGLMADHPSYFNRAALYGCTGSGD